MSTSVCVSVCLSVREHISRTTRAIFTKFLCMLPRPIVWWIENITVYKTGITASHLQFTSRLQRRTIVDVPPVSQTVALLRHHTVTVLGPRSSGGVTKCQGEWTILGVFFPVDNALCSIAFETNTKRLNRSSCRLE